MFVEFSRSSRSPSRRRSHSLSRKGEARDLFDATAIENFEMLKSEIFVIIFSSFSKLGLVQSWSTRSYGSFDLTQKRDLFAATAIENFEMLKSEIFVNIFLSRPSSNINTIDGNKPGPFILPNFEKFSGTDPNI